MIVVLTKYAYYFRLAYKVQKLSEDLSRNGRSNGQNLGIECMLQQVNHKNNWWEILYLIASIGSPTSDYKPTRKEPKENLDLIDELRSQLSHVSKTNSALKTKLQFFKSLHEAESRKRAPYDYIPPRVDSVSEPMHFFFGLWKWWWCVSVLNIFVVSK